MKSKSSKILNEVMVELGDAVGSLPNVELHNRNKIAKDLAPSALLRDIQSAAEAADVKVSINFAKSNHGKHTKSGNISRHYTSQGLDISTINGVKFTSKEGTMAGDKFVAELERLGYKRNSEGRNVKAVLWYMSDGSHRDHVHVSNISDSLSPDELARREKVSSEEPKTKVSGGVTAEPELIMFLIKKLKEKKIKSEDILPFLDKSGNVPTTDKDKKGAESVKANVTKDDEYVIINPDSGNKNVHVLFGGYHTNPSYSKNGASVNAMESYVSVLRPYSSDVMIVITHHMNTLGNVKKYVKDKFGANVTSVAGFSQGGKEAWEHAQDSSLRIVGLIDPSTYGEHERLSLGSNTYLVCNPKNWGGSGFYGATRKRLSWYCDNQEKYSGHVECVNVSHWGMLKYFYEKYGSRL